jgi:hypothetical protein
LDSRLAHIKQLAAEYSSNGLYAKRVKRLQQTAARFGAQAQ